MKILITGATGMVGQGVLLESIADPQITEIILLSRSSIGKTLPKVREVLLQDFTQVAQVQAQLQGIEACFHCMGISSVGVSKQLYEQITYGVTKALVDTMYEVNPQMTFIYVSGLGTDESERRSGWAGIKGKTENYMLAKGFKQAYAFRPGGIIPEKGVKPKAKFTAIVLKLVRPFFGFFKRFQSITTTSRIGQSMLYLLAHPIQEKHVYGAQMNTLAKAYAE